MQTNQPVRETMTKNPARALSLACAIALPLIAAQPAAACGSEPILGEICTFGFNFCPNGYLPADGRLVQIQQNSALYSLFGTYFGGDGRVTFAVPDLRGRAVVGTGITAGSGTQVQLGQVRGAEQASLTVNQMPAHSHAAQVTQPSVNVTLNAKQANATDASPQAGQQLGIAATGGRPATATIYAGSGAEGANVALGGLSASASGTGVAIGQAGASQPVPILPPELGMTVCIAAQGIYPQRP